MEYPMTDDKPTPEQTKASIRRLAKLLAAKDDDDEKPGGWAAFITATVALGLLFPIAYLRGWAALKLWQWFAAPVWPSVHLTIYAMFGLMLLLQAFRSHSEFKSNTDGSSDLSKTWSNLITSVCYPLAIVGVAWIWTWLAWGQ
jgi:hypothetical protein